MSLTRCLVLVAALAACGGSKARGPEWPEPSKTADDGGESIEPQPSAKYAAAIEKSADDDDKPAAAAATPAAATSEDKDKDKPATSPTPSTPSTAEDVLMSEEIIIEIDD